MLAMAAGFKLLKSLFFCFLLVGDIGPQPACLEAHLPRVPLRENQANVLFSPTHFYVLDFRLSLVCVVPLYMFMFGDGFFLLSLMSVVLHLFEWLWMYWQSMSVVLHLFEWL